MSQILIVVISAFLAVFLSYQGFSYSSYQFWVIMICLWTSTILGGLLAS
jgi:hypothetical protein